ncbi:hypothetical protein EBB59_10125 [Lysobacter pythonis]|uniref:DUF4156 domain-containing protein n=2 Tax=Solilutibacter pythonis TaxID=2483112 RepID=A0A3M2HSZ2_9GAMM|nr:hypothetical protein EBB59_10125 [Lysobacter pythonis]
MFVLAGCASAPLVTGTARAPIDPSQVRIYYGPPDTAYEEVARLDVASGAFTYGERNKNSAILERLRKQAASVGANGVIFQHAMRGAGGPGVSIGAGGGRIGGHGHGGVGVGVSISPRQKYGSGIAIHVQNPPDETPGD